jgi:hypothetical protein
MLRKVLIGGVLGGIVLFAWTFIANAILYLTPRVEMKRIPNEREVYEVLKKNIVEPGGYMCNPALTPEGIFPPGEPVFGIHYGGVGHESAGWQMAVHTPLGFLATIIAAWLLAVSSARVLCGYVRRVGFFVVIGVLIAVFSDLTNFGIGSHPFNDALLLAANDVVSWTLVGLAVAWRVRPEPAT